MTDYSDLNARQLYELLLENISKQLNGIDRSDKVKSIKQEADKRDSKLYQTAFDDAISSYSPQIELSKEVDIIPKHLEFLKDQLADSNYSLAEVIGCSMVNRNIREGDHILIDCKQLPQNGDVVLAEYKGQTFVKNYYKSKDSIELRSSNPLFKNIVIESEDKFEVLGKVIMILKDI